MNNLDNWDSFKKKVFVFNNNNIKNKKKIIKGLELNLYFIKKLILNFLNLSVISLGLLRLDLKNSNIHNLINIFIKLNIKKLNQIEKKTIFKFNDRNLFIVIDSRHLKTRIIAFKKNKCILTSTNGLVFKKWVLIIKST